MSKLIKTASGSTYELDADLSRVRRLASDHDLPPTERQGTDGEWQTYEFMTVPEVGRSMVFAWARRGPDDPMIQPATHTSPVVSIL